MTASSGTRRRAGNAMGRARAGILEGARRSLADGGLRGLTMSGVADRGGVAKATVYNHFRDRAELLDGLVRDTVDRLAQRAQEAPDPAAALAEAAVAAGSLPELRGTVARDPEAVAALARVGDGPVWEHARAAVSSTLAGYGVVASPAQVSVVLRWLTSAAVSDTPPEVVAAEASVVAAALTSGEPRPSPVPR